MEWTIYGTPLPKVTDDMRDTLLASGFQYVYRDSLYGEVWKSPSGIIISQSNLPCFYQDAMSGGGYV